MKSTSLLACAGLALAGSVWFGSALVAGGSARAEGLAGAATIVPAAAVAAEAEALGDIPDPSRVCVQAFSKDLCDSALEHGELIDGGCADLDCRTAYVQGAPWFINLLHNPQGCSGAGGFDGRCDEVPEKDGWLQSSITYTLRVDDPCALRGFFEGRWEHTALDGSVYKGTMHGTLGVGTHRRFQCNDATHRQCERCLDVEYLKEQGLWRIGVEASYVGRSNTGDELRFTLSGDFYAKGGDAGPDDLSGGWRFQGTADGAHVLYCQ